MKLETVLLVGILTLGPQVSLGVRNASASGDEKPATRLQHGASSIEGLIDDFVRAINEKDKARLRQLRVSQDEYIGVILPGSVEPGARKPQYNQEETEYLWGIVNGKSIYAEAGLLESFGGHHATVTGKEFRKGTTKYADYTAYKSLVLTLKDDNGTEATMRIGSIAEVDGQFKFISYARD